MSQSGGGPDDRSPSLSVGWNDSRVTAFPRRDPGVSVTARVLRVLDAFSAERRRLSLSEISRIADLPIGTAHRLVGELTAWGALEREASGCYHVGVRLWEVGALAPRTVGLREAALPFLEDLYEATHEN